MNTLEMYEIHSPKWEFARSFLINFKNHCMSFLYQNFYNHQMNKNLKYSKPYIFHLRNANIYTWIPSSLFRHVLRASSELQLEAPHGILSHPSVCPVHPHCCTLLGVLLDKQGGHSRQGWSGWVITDFPTTIVIEYLLDRL